MDGIECQGVGLILQNMRIRDRIVNYAAFSLASRYRTRHERMNEYYRGVERRGEEVRKEIRGEKSGLERKGRDEGREEGRKMDI